MLETEARQIAAHILSLRQNHPIRVGIDGFCAAGKTTFADVLAHELTERGRRVIRAGTDDFQHPPEIRWQLGETSLEGFYRHSVDQNALIGKLLQPLGPEGTLRYRTSTYDIHNLRPNLSPVFQAKEHDILILDGLFLHIAPVLQHLDYTVFIKADYETCIKRACARNQERRADADEVERLYRIRYVPGFEMYIEEVEPEKVASVVVLGRMDK